MSGSPVDALAEYCTIRFDDDVTVHLFEVAAGLRVGRARRDRGPRPGAPGLGAGPGRAGRRPGASGPVPPRRGDGQAGPLRDGHRPRHHLAVARRRGAGRRPARRAGSPGRGSSSSAPGRWARAWSRPWPAHGVDHLVVANRTAERAEAVVAALAPGAAGSVVSADLGGLDALLAAADVVLTTVGTSHPIVDRAMLGSRAGGDGPGRTTWWWSTSGCPATWSPSRRRSPASCCSTWTTSRAAVAEAIGGRQDEVAAATGHRAPTRSSATGPRPGPATRRRSCRRCARRVEDARLAELDRHRSKRSDLDEAQWEQVDAVTRSLLAKLLHQPTVTLKEAAGTPRGERLVEAAARPLRPLTRVRAGGMRPAPGPLRLATRGSPLALWQARRVAVAARPPAASASELVVVDTEGDRRTDVPLAQLGGQGVFVKEVQAAVLRGDADAAVHSAKDLPAADARRPRPGAGRVPGAGRPPRRAGGRRPRHAAHRRDRGHRVGPPAGPAGQPAARPHLRRPARQPGHPAGPGGGGRDHRGGGRLGRARPPGLAAARRGRGRDARAGDPAPPGGPGCPGRRVPRRRRGAPSRSLAAIDDAGVRAVVAAERAFLAELGGGCTLPVGAHAVAEPPGRTPAAPAGPVCG